MTEKPRETQAESHVVELKEKVNNSSLMKHRHSGLELHAAGRAIEITIDGHPDATDLLTSRNQQRPDDQLGRKEREVLAVELDRPAEDAVRYGVRQACRSHWAEGRPLSFPRLHAYSNHGYDQLLQRWSTVVEHKIP